MSSRSKTPFYRISYADQGQFPREEAIAFEAEFPLPDDGTPDTFNRLVIRIVLEEPNAPTAEVQLFSRTGWKSAEQGGSGTGKTNDKRIGQIICNIENLSDLLYQFASIKTRSYLAIT